MIFIGIILTFVGTTCAAAYSDAVGLACVCAVLAGMSVICQQCVGQLNREPEELEEELEDCESIAEEPLASPPEDMRSW